jgi:hypothetical protein
MLSIGGTVVAIGIGLYGYDSWAGWHYRRYGGFETIGIDPIPGAELVSFSYDPPHFLPDYDATWVYKVPSSYTEKLYKDCSVLHYKTGVVIGYEKDGSERIDPKVPGCHHELEFHGEFISVQFSGELLTIKDIYTG